jgi:hypothetical protein
MCINTLHKGDSDDDDDDNNNNKKRQNCTCVEVPCHGGCSAILRLIQEKYCLVFT